jgi:signal transduction histidine kinase
MGCGALVAFGLAGGSGMFLMLFVLEATLLFGIYAGFTALAMTVLLMGGCALAVARHWLTFTADANLVNTSLPAWGAATLACGLFLGTIVATAGTMYRALLSSLDTACRRAEKLQQLTGQLEAEIVERQQAEDALTHGRAFLDATIDLLPMPLFIVSSDQQLLRQNQAYQTLLQQLAATEWTDLRFLAPLTRAPIPQAAQPATRALQGEIVTAEEYILLVPNNEEGIPCLVNAAPIRVMGEVVAAATLIEDISVLKESDQAKDEFLAVLSHELNTPLTSILGWSELALVNNTPAFLRQAIEVVHRNAKRQRALVTEMLDMSKLLYRKLCISPILTDIRLQAQFAMESAQQQAQDQSLIVMFDAGTEPLRVIADPERIQQCFSNLLQNSLKFTAAGGSISITCLREETWAIFRVEDTGRGIGPEALRQIFNLFYQSNRDERAGGMGLGLAITRGIVELHGGQIWANSPGEGQGCTFTIALPLVMPER